MNQKRLEAIINKAFTQYDMEVDEKKPGGHEERIKHLEKRCQKLFMILEVVLLAIKENNNVTHYRITKLEEQLKTTIPINTNSN